MNGYLTRFYASTCDTAAERFRALIDSSVEHPSAPLQSYIDMVRKAMVNHEPYKELGASMLKLDLDLFPQPAALAQTMPAAMTQAARSMADEEWKAAGLLLRLALSSLTLNVIHSAFKLLAARKPSN